MNERELAHDLRGISERVFHDTNLWLHVERIIDLAESGYYHLECKKKAKFGEVK